MRGVTRGTARRAASGIFRSDDEALLRSTDDVVAGMPVLECSNCHFQADHYFWYEDGTYARRMLKFCPKCNIRILGVVVRHGQ